MRNISFVKKYAKMKLANEPTGHDYLHADRVANNAKKLAVGLDVNLDVILACCYIHDLIDEKLDEKFKSTPKIINDTLVLAGFIADEINHIAQIDYPVHIDVSPGNANRQNIARFHTPVGQLLRRGDAEAVWLRGDKE